MKESVPGKYPPPLVVDAVRHFVHGVSKILWRIKYHNKENIPQNLSGGLLIVANHQTYFDPFWICAPMRRKFRFMAWDKAFGWFFVGWMIRYLGSFPVDTTRGTTKSVLRESYRSLKEGATLVVFPEGARTFPDGHLLEFKTGAVRIAMEANVPILPVTVRGAHRVWSQTMKYPHFPKVEIFYHPLFHVAKPVCKDDLREYLDQTTAALTRIIGSKL